MMLVTLPKDRRRISMNDTQSLTTIIESTHLDLAISAWLHKHGKHDDEHTRTSKAYEETMTAFRAGLQREGLDLDSDPGKVALLSLIHTLVIPGAR
jgi:hypothetical protein